MASWTRLETFDAAELDALGTGASAVLDTVADFFAAAAATLDLLSKVAVDEFDPIGATLEEALSEIEQTVLDLMENNVYVAVHTNVNWDPTWRYDKKGRAKVKDFVHDAQLPWAGNGLGGWLDDINASANDPRNVFRPVTDAETAVRGLVFVVGVTSSNEMSSLKTLYDLLLGGWDVANIFDAKAALERLDAAYAPLTKLGAGMGDAFMQELVAVREGYEGFADPATYLPTPGNFPIWASVPIARLFPPVYAFLQQLAKFIASMKPSGGYADILSTLASLLAQKAETLSEIADELAGAIQTVEDLLDLLDSGYFVWIEAEEGGFPSWINSVRSADLVVEGGEIVGPDFGDAGIVAGFVVVATADDPANHLQTLVRMVTGMSFEGQSTTQAQRLEDTYSDEF